MTRPVLLNNIDHRTLRVDPGRGAALGDAVMFAPTYPGEFRGALTHYPIVFRKTTAGAFEPVLLLGLREGQNLFLDGERWDAYHLPLAMDRQPFMIGGSDDQLMMHIDLDSPRLAGNQGEALFDEQGHATAFLDRMNSVLLTLHQGLQATPAFVAALLDHDLLESFVLDVTDAGGSTHRLSGFYTVHEERLRALGGDALERLNRAGHLESTYMVLASLSNFRDLIERYQRSHDDRT